MKGLKSQLRLTREFYRLRLRKLYWICMGSFLLLMLLFLFFFYKEQDLTRKVMAFFSNLMQQQGIRMDEPNSMFWGILGNNLRAMVVSVLYGCIPFLFLPLLPLGVNSVLLGAAGAATILSRGGMGVVFFAVGILPHGIFEIPAMMLSIACGFLICKTLTLAICKEREAGIISATFFGCLRIFLFCILPLVLFAALAETYLTPALLDLLL